MTENKTDDMQELAEAVRNEELLNVVRETVSELEEMTARLKHFLEGAQ